MLTTIVVGLLVFGVVLTNLLFGGVMRGTTNWQELLTQVLLGGVLLVLDVQGLLSLEAFDARLARECYGPSERELLQQRISQLAA
ncbi:MULTISPECIES: hypothetical protein [Streptomyces]|uniref:Uncharacterized protein n=1 Tax=Streptomyces xanthochromogenes TaxID=67384 RepID=A0ABQ3ATX7_9ACTN|nr:hypothetical protein [Streptomyces sp. SID1034]GGY64059.1 hypothetical protein GCM10010326_68440 [Streptomyces xanthochromogenes]